MLTTELKNVPYPSRTQEQYKKERFLLKRQEKKHTHTHTDAASIATRTSEAKTFLGSKPIEAAPTPSWDWITFACESGARTFRRENRKIRHGGKKREQMIKFQHCSRSGPASSKRPIPEE